jgi:hypothetical protein
LTVLALPCVDEFGAEFDQVLAAERVERSIAR